MSWHLDCFVESEKVFPVNSYSTDDVLVLWQDIKNTLGRTQSGITMIKVYNDDRPAKEWKFTSIKDAWEELGTFVVFA